MKRRSFVAGAAAGVSTLGFLSAGARAQSKEIRMIESGGLSGDSIEKGYIEPLMKKSGIKVVRESPSSLGKLRALVESGQKDTVLFELGQSVMVQAKQLGLIEPLDWAAINPAAMFPEAKNEYGFGYQYFSTIAAWRKGAKEPKNMTEFFDLKAFPGKRCLPDYPHYLLPFCVQAAGVPIEKIFPLDVDLAFKKLEEIKKDVSVWWKAGAQPAQLLKDNEVQYAICWSGRVVNEPTLAMSFVGGKADLSYFGIVKGSKPEDKAAAYKLLHEMSLPENQAEAAKVISYTGSSPELEPLLPKDKLWQFPTAKQNKAVQYFEDADWWVKNGEAVNKKWEAFKLNL